MRKCHICPVKSAISATFRLDVIKCRVTGGKRLKTNRRKEKLQQQKWNKTADQVKIRSII